MACFCNEKFYNFRLYLTENDQEWIWPPDQKEIIWSDFHSFSFFSFDGHRRCTGWWRRSRGCSARSSPASSPASRGSSSPSSSSSSFLPSVFAGVPTSYRSGDRPCSCPRRQALIISRAWTDQHLQQPVNALKYISHLVYAICWHINIQISHLCFETTQRHSWCWNRIISSFRMT